MPEITEAQMLEFGKYQSLGTFDAVARKIAALETDNRDQREEIRGLKEKLPGEDQVVVSKEDADLLPKYKDLGEPKDLKAKLEAGTTATTDLAKRVRRDAALAYVGAAGLAEETVDTLIALPDMTSAVFEVESKKVQNDKGQEVEEKHPILVLTDDKGKEERLDFVKAQERFPAMKGLKMAAPLKPGQKPPATFVQQSPGSRGGASETLYERIRRERAEEQEAAKKAQETRSVDQRLGLVRPT